MIKSIVLLVGLVALASAVPLARREICNKQSAGRFKNLGSKPVECVSDTSAMNGVMCCSTGNPYPDGKWKEGKCNNIFAGAKKMAEGKEHKFCQTATFDNAKAYCESVNAHLCTVQEIANDCVTNVGCGVASKYVWTIDGEDSAPKTDAPETNIPETDAPETDEPEADAPETDAPETDTPETDAPETDAPQTDAPQTDAPDTDAPETDAPETDAPETNAPETDEPETDAPEMGASETDALETDAPETDAPETDAPETDAPETDAPETDAPETDAPETDEPETDAPETDAPETDAPDTDAPETDAPETDAPETDAPETDSPVTDAPETDAPETDAPETDAPETDTPETDAPETDAPETDAPETDAPETDAPETDAPVTDVPEQETDEQESEPESDDSLHHIVVVGASRFSNNKQPKFVDNGEAYSVRCCSTASSKPSTAGGWMQSKLNACNGLFAASQKMKDGDDHKRCRPKMTYDDAKAYCTSVDARLCTKTEMENDCTAGSGCSISGKYLWTSSVESDEQPQPTEEPEEQATGEPEEPLTTTEPEEQIAHLVEKNGKAESEIEVVENGKWSVRTAAKGYQSTSYYCWEGRDAYNIKRAGRATLTYTVDISLPGRYQIEIRKYHDKEDNTEGNDVWLQVDDLGWVKVYDGAFAKWTWDTFQSWENIPGKIWNDPRFEMGVGRHTIKISARSNGLCMDAIRIQHRPEAIPTTQAVTTRTPRVTKQPKTMDDMQMIEVDGYAKAEVEDVDRNGWKKKTDVAGFTGTAYYKWGGKNRYQKSQAGKSGLLTFEVFVTNPGDYTVQIRKYHDNEDNTQSNDCWLEVDENEIIKVFDGTVGEWDETTIESWEHRDLFLKKTNDPRYYLSAGFHTIRISARSKGLAIDSVSITKIDHTRVNPF